MGIQLGGVGGEIIPFDFFFFSRSYDQAQPPPPPRLSLPSLPSPPCLSIRKEHYALLLLLHLAFTNTLTPEVIIKCLQTAHFS